MSGRRRIERPICDRIGQAEAQAEVDRLLSDPLFQSPERNRSFLRFIATEFFEGRAENIKAYTIAVDVFGRPSDFDPSIDPIVRIEATRLRAALTQYYDAHGGRTDIRVDLPRGRYVPVFTRTTPVGADEPTSHGIGRTPVEERPLPVARAKWYAWASSLGSAVVWLTAGVGVATYLLTGGFGTWNNGGFTHKPLVFLTVSTERGSLDREAARVRDYLMVAISQFQTVRLGASDRLPSSASAAQWAGATLASSLRGQVVTNDYQVVIKYEADGKERFVWWQVNDAATGEALISGMERSLEYSAETTPKNWNLVSDLARTLVGPRGVINNIETLRDLNRPSLGNGCILRARAALGQGDGKKIANARDCLERTLAIAPNDAGAKTELAILLLSTEPAEAPSELFARAHALASEAVTLAPFSDRSKYALMISQFQAGQTRAAIETGYAAMTLNPNNGDIPARLGFYLFTIGRWEEGNGLAMNSARMDGNISSDILLTRALSAYRLGRYQEAFTLSQQFERPNDFVANAILAASAGQMGRAGNASAALRSLQAERRDFGAVFRRNMAARHFAPQMIELLGIGLTKARLRSS